MEDVLILSEDGKTLLDVKDKSVREVVIPDGVEIIGHSAFRDCSLEGIIMPDTINSIKSDAFASCI